MYVEIVGTKKQRMMMKMILFTSVDRGKRGNRSPKAAKNERERERETKEDYVLFLVAKRWGVEGKSKTKRLAHHQTRRYCDVIIN